MSFKLKLTNSSFHVYLAQYWAVTHYQRDHLEATAQKADEAFKKTESYLEKVDGYHNDLSKKEEPEIGAISKSIIQVRNEFGSISAILSSIEQYVNETTVNYTLDIPVEISEKVQDEFYDKSVAAQQGTPRSFGRSS